jgi:endoglucanase
MINRAQNTFINRGIPVVIGEFGAMNKNNVDMRADWAEFYVKTAMDKGIPCFWWDNGAFSGGGELFGLLIRQIDDFPFPQIVDALMRGTSDWNPQR